MAPEEDVDDYREKPFNPHELVARIRAVLRRVLGADLSSHQYIETIPGQGYRCVAPVEAAL